MTTKLAKIKKICINGLFINYVTHRGERGGIAFVLYQGIRDRVNRSWWLSIDPGSIPARGRSMN